MVELLGPSSPSLDGGVRVVAKLQLGNEGAATIAIVGEEKKSDMRQRTPGTAACLDSLADSL
jgi:hypothetical protein